MRVAVGSMNPVKLEAAKALCSYGSFTFEQIDAKSDAPAQPKGRDQTREGAIARANDALAQAPKADYGLGIEGGVRDDGTTLWCFATVAIVDRNGKVGISATGEFALPEKVRKLVLDGMEVGHADDTVFGRENSKQKDGIIGVLTNGALVRSKFYDSAVLSAFIPFLHPELYPQSF